MKKQKKARRVQNSVKSARKVRGNPSKIVLHRWPKGVSGNPGGRPKKTPLTDMLRKIFSVPGNAEALAEALVKKAIREGRYTDFKEICDRVEGKVPQRIELTGEDSGPVRFEDVRAKLLDKLAG